jgi:phenylpropionate dioxygenase-like ring-hydroxylating dioxygenase large terminal subunit
MTTPVTPRVGPDPKSYFDPLVFQREQREVFQRAWCFVAFSWELAKPNDFVTRTLGGVSVVVQNFGGELKALHNVCAHRCSLIRTAPCGNGPLTCGFHGWTYDGRGVPVGIPGNAEFFGFTDEQKQARALRSFALETCGAFVFVRIAAEGAGLRAFLGPQWAVLQTLSKHFGAQPPLDDHRMPWATNWKVGVESVLEVYHVNPTHPDTFKKLVLPAWHFSPAGPLHSTAKSILRDEMRGWWDRIIARLGLSRAEGMAEYDHFVLFPNVAIGVTHGALMSFQTYEPVSPTECVLHYRMVLANSARMEPASTFVRKSVTEFNRVLLEEDRLAAENVQRGLRQASRPPVWGVNEGRIGLFHDALSQFEEVSG